jgi:hypothetical protein
MDDSARTIADLVRAMGQRAQRIWASNPACDPVEVLRGDAEWIALERQISEAVVGVEAQEIEPC